MQPGESIAIADLCRTRKLQRQEQVRNDARAMSDTIERSAEPLSDEDAQRPFMIPQNHSAHDIWHLIMDQIIDPQEILKLWEVSPLFREILSYRQKYVQARLPQIVQIVLEKRPGYLPTSASFGPSAGVTLWHPNILDLRKISKICKNSVEGVLESSKLFFDVADGYSVLDDISAGVCTKDSFFFRSLKVDEQFLDFDDEDDAEIFYDGFEAFLKVVGHNVRTFYYNSVLLPQGVYDMLGVMMKLLPNLETLWLSYDLTGLNAVLALVTPNPNYDDLEPFTPCPHLRSITQSGRYLPQVYLRRIIDACPSIRTLEMLSSYNGEELQGLIDPPEMNAKLQNLQRLQTPLNAMLLLNLGLQMPLKTIIFKHHETAPTLTTLGVFTFLNQFRDTLEHVEMYTSIRHEDNCFLNLPRLKVFKWPCNTSFRDMRFLLHAGHLEEIQVEVYQHVLNEESFIDWCLSNVTKGFKGFTMWQVFQRLKEVVIYFPWRVTDGRTPTFIYKRDGSSLRRME